MMLCGSEQLIDAVTNNYELREAAVSERPSCKRPRVDEKNTTDNNGLDLIISATKISHRVSCCKFCCVFSACPLFYLSFAPSTLNTLFAKVTTYFLAAEASA